MKVIKTLPKTLLEALRTARRDVREFLKTYKKTFFVLCLLYALGASAIMRANVYYADDLGRAVEGSRGWGNHGRYLSSALSILLHTGTGLRDVSPLTQFIAVCFLAAAGCVVLHVLSDKRGFNLWAAVAVLPMGLSPYFLECLSYKFDSPYMALSILASAAPFLLYRRNLALFCAASAVGNLTMCLSYQASSGVFPMLAALLCFRLWSKRQPLKRVFGFLAASVVGYVTGLLLFRRIFACLSAGGNATYASIASISAGPDVKETVISNLTGYFSQIRADFTPWWLKLVAFMALAFVYIAVRDSGRNRLLALFFAPAALLAALLMSYGAYAVLPEPMFTPRAMLGFGAFLSFLSVSLAGAEKAYPAKLMCFALSWVFFVFAFIYGNALYQQQQYVDFRVTALMNDLKDLECLRAVREEEDRIPTQIYGRMVKAPVLTHSRPNDNYELLDRLIRPTFYEGFGWSFYYFLHYFSIDKYIVEDDYSQSFRHLGLPLLKDTVYHSIWGDGEKLLIQIK